jgi:hypothetical protein
MSYEFHPEALDEYADAARYYAGCQEGLELRFIVANFRTGEQAWAKLWVSKSVWVMVGEAGVRERGGSSERSWGGRNKGTGRRVSVVVRA